jgi:hypothetical protein
MKDVKYNEDTNTTIHEEYFIDIHNGMDLNNFNLRKM